MQFYLYIFSFLIIYLLLINFFLIKFKISLDNESINETHKSLLRENNLTPLSGTFYFLPIILILFYFLDTALIAFCSLLFIIGLLADLKVITSYKLRLIFQFLSFSLLFFINKEIMIDTRIAFVNDLMSNNLTRILVCTFFFMVLINGFNLIDGTNCLCTLNFALILIFIYSLIIKLNINYFNDELKIFLVPILIFLFLNFFGYNFLGDGAAYGLGFFLGYILLNLSLINNSISPYFIANLLWYPAFENLFSILRRNFSKTNNYLPDNDHLHQLVFKFYKKKTNIKKNFLISSLVGISINSILFINYFIGLNYYNHTVTQVILIVAGIFLYLMSYYILKKKLG
tara:strand:- start:341 stop:1369 length:1029 start_codon:yes stop_codon:yes gene_type:complete